MSAFSIVPQEPFVLPDDIEEYRMRIVRRIYEIRSVDPGMRHPMDCHALGQELRELTGLLDEVNRLVGEWATAHYMSQPLIIICPAGYELPKATP